MDKIINWTLDQIISDRFGRYSKYIIQERALPDARDGLKPVQRRILYAMNDLHLFHDKPFKKSARIVGEVIGKYHPHGDTSIYDALVRISQKWKINMPLINMHGNNGSIDDDPAAAMRYTEVRLTKIAESMLLNIQNDFVDFVPNFDDSEQEPVVLPGLFPNLLVNGAKGIAAGFATEMPPHNLGEIIKALIIRIKSPNCRLDTIMNVVKGPDFPTYGEIIGVDGIYKALERGSGRIIIRSKYKLNTSKTNPNITITEIPYGVVKSKLVKEIDEIIFFNKIYGIKEIRDETDRNGLKIYIKLLPGVDAQMILLYLLKKSQLQIYYSYNNVAITNNAPKQMSLINLLDAYIEHQQKVILSHSICEYNKKKTKLEIVMGLIKATHLIDKIINLIRKFKGTKKDIIIKLQEKFNFTELQATAITDLKLYRLSQTDESLFIKDEENLKIELGKLSLIINDEKMLNKHLINQLSDFSNKFTIPRKTKIIEENEELPEINNQALIKNENIYIGISKFGYIKNISNKSFLSNQIIKYQLKDNDMLVYFKLVNSLDTLFIFTNKGRFLKIQTHKIIACKFSSNGIHLNDMVNLYSGERIINCFEFSQIKNNDLFILATKNGKIKTTLVSVFNKRVTTKFSIAFKLDNIDELISVKQSNNLKNIIVITNHNHAVKYPETIIPPTSCSSSGVKSIKLKEDNYVAGIVVAYDEQVIGLISHRGGLKRIKVKKIYPYSRTSYGKLIALSIKGNPHIIENLSIVSPSTKYIVNINGKLIENKFNQVDITDDTSGFSKIHPKINGSIIFYNKEDNKSIIDAPKTMEQRFDDVEKKINKISQLSIDELLGNK